MNDILKKPRPMPWWMWIGPILVIVAGTLSAVIHRNIVSGAIIVTLGVLTATGFAFENAKFGGLRNVSVKDLASTKAGWATVIAGVPAVIFLGMEGRIYDSILLLFLVVAAAGWASKITLLKKIRN
jgi:hypothetical protein